MISSIFLRVLHTLEPHRNKGYGKILVKILCKKIVEQHHVEPVAFVADVNQISRKLLDSVGFTVRNDCCWFGLNKV